MARNYIQGIYEVKNKAKYVGTKNPRYLSSYELKFFEFCDRHPLVLEWGSETVVIKYYNPVKQRMARYLLDVYIKYQDAEGNIHKEYIEIKPAAQTRKPKKGNKSAKTYGYEMMTWMVNEAKWQEATKQAEARNMKFRIVTENSIFNG